VDSGDPNPSGGGGPAPTPAPAPAPSPAPAPPAFDPSSLSPEAQAYLDSQVKAERDKSRNFEKAREAKATEERIRKEYAERLGLTPAEVSPDVIKAELDKERATTAQLRAQIDIGRACRNPEIDADEDLVGAVLAQRGTLKALDPSAPDYAAKVAEAVKALVTEKPNLKRTQAPVGPPPPGGRQPGATFPAPTDPTKRPGLTDAINAAITAGR
jgi:hypothetical protein